MALVSCRQCGNVIADVTAMSKDQLRAAALAARSPFAGAVGMIPADFIEKFSQWMKFDCVPCLEKANGTAGAGPAQQAGFFDGIGGENATENVIGTDRE